MHHCRNCIKMNESSFYECFWLMHLKYIQSRYTYNLRKKKIKKKTNMCILYVCKARLCDIKNKINIFFIMCAIYCTAPFQQCIWASNKKPVRLPQNFTFFQKLKSPVTYQRLEWIRLRMQFMCELGYILAFLCASSHNIPWIFFSGTSNNRRS